ncbi:MAG: FIST C-terminal domain-containing protein [Deltaproteobacteria bacterium]|nr:FIST C-terminal domain-containing protein [Deltaproteobacteria bacterium]
MKVGIGVGNCKDSFGLGRFVAGQAIQDGKINSPSFALAFCGVGTNGYEFFDGIRSVIGAQVPVLGGSGIGIITNHVISYDNYPAGLLLIEDHSIQARFALAEGLDKDEHQAGRLLANQFSLKSDTKLFLFYDSVRIPPKEGAPPVMNSSKPLLQGIADIIGSGVPIIGAGTVGDFDFSPTVQFAGDSVKSRSAVALVLDGDNNADFVIMHGCSPKSGLCHTITRAEGAVIYEIDNQPIVKIINEMYGSEEWQQQHPVKRLSLGVNHGEKFNKEFFEKDYVNRLIVGVLPDKSGIVLFEPDLGAGDEIQFMLRNPRQMITSARKNSETLIETIKNSGKKPLWGFYIDCAGRTALFSETLQEEATEVQEVFNRNNIPLFGFYSGVEIAPFINKNRGLDWTGVLTVFSK